MFFIQSEYHLSGTDSALNKIAVFSITQLNDLEVNMAWETPAFSDVRFGFEVTMYISNR